MEKYPNLRLVVSEQTTDQIIEKLETNQLDAGIMATPLANHKLIELPLYKENFVVYSGPGALQHNGDYILARDIDLNRLWLLEEGHCLRNQVINLCELKKASKKMNNLEYEAGSIDSLIRIVDANDGVTIIPELASLGFTAKAKTRLQYFFPPAPNREISLVTYRYYVKDRLIDLLRSEIKSAVQPFFGKKEYAEPALSPILG